MGHVSRAREFVADADRTRWHDSVSGVLTNIPIHLTQVDSPRHCLTSANTSSFTLALVLA